MSMPEDVRRRRRLQMILIFAVFGIPPLVATILGFTGWDPGTRGHGEPILPQYSVAEVVIDTADGGTWAWRDPEKPRLTLVALPGPGCARQCLATLALMRNARITLNRNMDRLRLLYVGAPPGGLFDPRAIADWPMGTDPADALGRYRPEARDAVAAVLVESNGTALSWYPAGFDPSGLRKDLQKVVR